MVVLYAAFFLIFTLTKHASFMTYMADLGIYDHRLWLFITEGDPIFPIGMNQSSQLMYLIGLGYFLNPRAETFLIIQAPIIALGGLGLYKLAKKKILGTMAPLVITAVYFLYPPLHGLSQFDFHLEAFIPTLFFWAAYSFTVKRWKAYIFFTVMLLATMKYAPLLTLMFGFYLVFTETQIVQNILKSLKNGLNSRKLKINLRLDLPNDTAFKLMLATILASALILVAQNAAVPDTDLARFVTASGPSLLDRGTYILKLYSPLAFISFLSPSHLIMTVPWFTFTFLTNNAEHLQIYNQYSAFVFPFIFIGAISTMRKLSKRPKMLRYVSVLLLLSTTISFAVMDPVFSAPHPAHTIDSLQLILHFPDNHSDKGGYRRIGTSDHILRD